ncbi:MAG TPA: hypothetical protein VGM11_02680 [Acidobacteriaceae bacterium]|jgi:hypothetical protein
MPRIDREELVRSLTNHRPSICDQIEARRSVAPGLTAIVNENREEKTRLLEQAAQNAGVNLREFRASLARNREKRVESLTSLRSRTAAPQTKQPAPTSPSSRLFKSLTPLAGRAVPLAQPSSLSFLNEPVSFDKYEYGGNWLWNYSITTPGDVFCQTNIFTQEPSSSAVYTFRYVWYNDSDSTMLTSVVAGLSFIGYMFASAQDGYDRYCYEAQVREMLNATLDLGTPDDPSVESRSDQLYDLIADNGLWGLASGLSIQFFNGQDYSISYDGYLVAPNSSLVISVSAAFSYDWFWATPVRIGNFAEAHFGDPEISPQYRIGSTGVVVIASPVTVIL